MKHNSEPWYSACSWIRPPQHALGVAWLTPYITECRKSLLYFVLWNKNATNSPSPHGCSASAPGPCAMDVRWEGPRHQIAYWPVFIPAWWIDAQSGAQPQGDTVCPTTYHNRHHLLWANALCRPAGHAACSHPQSLQRRTPPPVASRGAKEAPNTRSATSRSSSPSACATSSLTNSTAFPRARAFPVASMHPHSRKPATTRSLTHLKDT